MHVTRKIFHVHTYIIYIYFFFSYIYIYAKIAMFGTTYIRVYVFYVNMRVVSVCILYGSDSFFPNVFCFFFSFFFSSMCV